jgi:hypothetical protein
VGSRFLQLRLVLSMRCPATVSGDAEWSGPVGTLHICLELLREVW